MRTTLQNYCQTKGFNMMSKVRSNTNGYKYVTLLHNENPGEPENLYLGVRFSETVEVGDRLTGELFVTETLNAQGEARLKLTDRNGDATETLEANGYAFI